jgi:hypothetical protein
MLYYGSIWPKDGTAKQHAVRFSHNKFKINNPVSGLCSDARSQADRQIHRRTIITKKLGVISCFVKKYLIWG